MKVVIIGLGSMGKRRLRLLKQHFDIESISGIDSSDERRNYCNKEYGISVYTSLEEAAREESFDCAFVCTSPLSHNEVIRQCLVYGIHVFTEINLVAEGYKENVRMAKEKNLKLFLSSTMIYRNEMQYLYSEMRDMLAPVSYNYHVGQYLPDWHPWETYNDFFVGDKRTNGCREILAIELPWIIRVFGKIRDIKVVRTRLTKLRIDYEDCYIVTLSHENGNTGVFMVDVVSREAVRDLKVIGEDVFISWGGTPDSFKRKNISNNHMEAIDLYKNIQREGEYNKTIIENQYVNEMNQFFGELEEKISPVYSFEQDLETLKLIDRIEKA